MKIENTDKLELFDYVDVTDPCYNSNIRVSYPCEPGKYETYHTLSDEGEWGNRVASCAIVHEDYLEDFFDDPSEMDAEDFIECANQNGYNLKEAVIGVDAGMAGFFDNKPDFDDSEWLRVCDEVKEGKVFHLSFDERDSFFTESGYGDGGYIACSLFNNDDKFVAGIIEFI